MKIETIYEPGDDFVTLRVICPPLKEKVVSVSVEALSSGALVLQEEIEREKKEAEQRLSRHRIVEKMVNDRSN